MATEEQRYWSKVAKGDDCWEWMGARRGRGYGMFWSGGRLVSAHRWMWERVGGPIPAGMDVCHRCDTPPCVRPSHLFLGSRAENVMDMDRKGRRHSTLSADEAVQVRIRLMAGQAVSDLARAFGVSTTAIYDIKHGRSWRRVA